MCHHLVLCCSSLTMQRLQPCVLCAAVGLCEHDQVKLSRCSTVDLEDGQVGPRLADVGQPQLDA